MSFEKILFSLFPIAYWRIYIILYRILYTMNRMWFPYVYIDFVTHNAVLFFLIWHQHLNTTICLILILTMRDTIYCLSTMKDTYIRTNIDLLDNVIIICFRSKGKRMKTNKVSCNVQCTLYSVINTFFLWQNVEYFQNIFKDYCLILSLLFLYRLKQILNRF